MLKKMIFTCLYAVSFTSSLHTMSEEDNNILNIIHMKEYESEATKALKLISNDTSKKNPLHYICDNRFEWNPKYATAVIPLLIEDSNVNSEAMDSKGMTPFDYAYSSNNFTSIDLLLEYIDAPDIFTQTNHLSTRLYNYFASQGIAKEVEISKECIAVGASIAQTEFIIKELMPNNIIEISYENKEPKKKTRFKIQEKFDAKKLFSKYLTYSQPVKKNEHKDIEDESLYTLCNNTINYLHSEEPSDEHSHLFLYRLYTNLVQLLGEQVELEMC